MSAIDDIAVERARQIATEGWTAAHDDAHTDGVLALAAASYVVVSADDASGGLVEIAQTIWPWAMKWWKPRDPRYNLVRAGALIVAEIERLDRIAALEEKS